MIENYAMHGAVVTPKEVDGIAVVKCVIYGTAFRVLLADGTARWVDREN